MGKKEMQQIDSITQQLIDFINEKKFPIAFVPAALCNVYCDLSSQLNIPPDVFIKTTMTIFSEYAGGEVVFMSSNDLEERESATLQ